MSKTAVVGLGYVGLPLAMALGRHTPTLGFDISWSRVQELSNGTDRNGELEVNDANSPQLEFSCDEAALADAQIYIVTVPTPVDEAHRPDLSPLISASTLVGRHLKRGDIVVFESTVYPGCTEEVCVPRLEEASGLKAPQDFAVGYSPERINPGDTEHVLETIVKIISAQTPEALEVLAQTYGQINGGQVHRAPNIRTAEAAKVIENTQRDLNIALMNELSMLFERLDIRTQDVLAAARTKWNFLPFKPGLVGGHCIPVDPYYLTHKAEMVGYHPEIILAGRRINDQMARYVAQEIVKMMAVAGMSLRETKVLILGATFKPNVRDLRNSQVFDLVKELESFTLDVCVHDPLVDPNVLHGRGVKVCRAPFEESQKFDVVVLATAHSAFLARTGIEIYGLLQAENEGIFVDLSGGFEGQQGRGPKHRFRQL